MRNARLAGWRGAALGALALLAIVVSVGTFAAPDAGAQSPRDPSGLHCPPPMPPFPPIPCFDLGARDVATPIDDASRSTLSRTAQAQTYAETQSAQIQSSPPAAPTGLTATAGYNSVTLTWNDPGDSSITGYEYNVNHNATSTGNFTGWGPWTVISHSAAGTTSHTITGLTNGREYRYHVRAVSGDTKGVAAPNAAPWYVSATPHLPAPANLTATAGNARVTLSWGDPNNSSITGYEYQVNHNATSTGNLSGWGPWIAIPGSGAATTTYAISGLVNGREYRYHVRAVSGDTKGVAAPNADPWYVAATPAVGPPEAPTGLTATAGYNSVTLTWNDPGDPSITGYEYNVNHNNTGTGNLTGWSPWTAIDGSGAATTTYTISGLAHGREYRYHLRAVNAQGPSVGAPATGPPWFVTATPLEPPPPPPPPGNISVERICDERMKVTWWPSSGATGYDLDASIGGGHWQRMLTNENFTGFKFTHWLKNQTYWFAVRAVNAGGESAWVNSAAAPPPPCAVANLRVTTSTPGEGDLGADGGIVTATWDAGQRATAYHLDYNGVRVESDLSSTSHSWGVSSRGASDTVSVQSRKDGMTSPATSAAVAWLTASSVEDTTATLNIAGHSGDWYVRKITPSPFGSCDSAGSGATHDLTGLTASTAHTFAAYSDSACANAMARTTFTTNAFVPYVSNLSETSDNIGIAVSTASDVATGFTTGTNGGGYALQSVTIKFHDTTADPEHDLTVAIHAASAGNPASTATYTLDGDDPTSAGEYSYTCSGDCSLAAGTTYFLVLSGTGGAGKVYHWDTTASPNQTNTPNNFGWSIADATKRYYNNAWRDDSGWTGMIKVRATENPALSVGNISSTGATLRVGGHTGDWYYQQSHPSSGSCTAVTGSLSKTLTLTADTTYAYGAYSDSTCGTAIGETAYFSTTDVFVGNLAEAASSYCEAGINVNQPGNSAGSIKCATAFTTGGQSGGYTLSSVTGRFLAKQETSGTLGNIVVAIHQADTNNSSNPASGDLVTLSGGNPDTAGLYTYTCSGSGCDLDANTTYFVVFSTADTTGNKRYRLRTTTSDVEATYPAANGWTIDNLRYKYGSTAWAGAEQPAIMHIAAASKAPKLTVSSITATGATLTIANHTTVWYYKATSGPHTACQSEVAAGTDNKAISGLTAGTSYTYSAYSDNGCSTLLATAAPFTTDASLTASSVTATTATLTIAGHTGDWYYKATSGPHTTCQGPVTAGTDNTAISGLTAGTSYTYSAYSNSTCTTLLARAAQFTTTNPSLTASLAHVSGSTYTLSLTISGWTPNKDGGWYYKHQFDECNVAGTNTTISGNGIYSSSLSYTFTAYSASSCTSGNLIATAPAVTPP